MGWQDRLLWLGNQIIKGMELIGETVADMLGFNDSRYQWVIDAMDEHDWKMAREVQAIREAEDLRYEAGQSIAMEEGELNSDQPPTDPECLETKDKF